MKTIRRYTCIFILYPIYHHTGCQTRLHSIAMNKHNTKQIRRACCLQPKDQEKPNLVRCPSHHSSSQASVESEPLAAKTWADESQLHNMDVGQVCLPVATTTVKPNVSLPSKGYRKCQDQQLLLASPSEGHITIASSVSKCLPHPQSAPEHIVQEPQQAPEK